MNILKKVATLVTLLFLLGPGAWATTISYASNHIGGTQWRYDYTVTNDSLTVPIDEFSIFFGSGTYANLHDVSAAPAWDILIIQPDPAIPADGFLDALAITATGIPSGASQSAFSISFDYLGSGTPPAQAYSIVDPASFIVIDSGLTSPLLTVPISSTIWLMLAGMLPLAWRHRKAACTLILATTLVACGGSHDQGQKTQLLSGVVSAVGSDSQFQVVSLEKAAEHRVDRTTYDYTYHINIKNNGKDDASNVIATLTGVPNGTTIVNGTINVGAIAAGTIVVPSDLLVLRINRTMQFNPAALVWNIKQLASIQMEQARPAETYVLPLADLGFSQGAESVTVTGAVTEALIKDGTLRFSTPGDTGVDQQAQFHLTHGGVTTTLALLIRTELPTAVTTYVEPLDDGSLPPEAPRLLVGGLDANNIFRPGMLTFRLEGTSAMDLKDDSDGLITGPGNTTVSLKQYWTFNPADGSFSIGATALTQLLAALPPGALNISLNFVSKDGVFAISYDLIAIKAGAKMFGQLVDSQGAEVTSLAGRTILLRGYNSHLRTTTTIDASGSFTFNNVIPDTYQVTLSDLNNPNVVSVSALVFNNSTEVHITLMNPTGSAKQKSFAQPSSPSGKVKQNGTGPEPRSRPSLDRPSKPNITLAAGGTTTFAATAAAQNQTTTTPIEFTVPKGTKNVGVKITVSTDEYPYWTTMQSQFNDTWSYSVVGLPNTSLSASGAVNQSHYTQGTVTKTSCVDVSSQAKDAAFNVTGAVSATNIGDDVLPTTTTVELSLACAGLRVTLSKFTSPNKDNHPVLQPINTTGNLRGPYVSVSQNGSDATHTVPLELQYTPADAEITEVNIGVSANAGDPGFTTDNLLGQVNTKTPGKIKFPSLTLPAFAGAMGAGKVAITVRVKGKIEGTEVTSDPVEGGQVSFNGDTAFIPLSLAGTEAGLSGRRYGGRDPGGDSWATRQVINWLASRSYRFDDISGQHVAQKSGGDSILSHKGHSDGQQIDMRYADGQGGYSDALGGSGDGAEIQQLINAAAAEVAANAKQKPKLAALTSWITDNRVMLEAEAASGSTRIIHIGPSFVKLALVDGKFSNAATASIPGIAAWNKPVKVHITAGHLSHWHLSMTAHP